MVSRGSEAWRDKREVDGMISLFGPVGLVVAADDIGTMRSAVEDDVGAVLLVAEFGDTTGRGLALDSDADHDDVVGLEEALVDGCVGTGTVVFTAVESQDLEDFSGKGGVRLAEAEVVMDSREFTEDGSRHWSGG